MGDEDLRRKAARVLSESRKSIEKGEDTVTRIRKLQSDASSILAKLDPTQPEFDKLLINVGRLTGNSITREELEQLASGVYIDKYLNLNKDIDETDAHINDLRQKIRDMEQALESEKPVETAVPRVHGHYDYRMLVDEANDAKAECIKHTVAAMPPNASFVDWMLDCVSVAPQSETFVFSPDIMKIVVGTAERVPPDFRIFEERLVTNNHQWWWWGPQVGSRLGLVHNGRSISGMLISRAFKRELPGVSISILFDLSPKHGCFVAPCSAWMFNTTLSAADMPLDADGTTNAANARITRLMAACLSWMSQKMVVTSLHQPSRGLRKRLDTNKVVHTTNVVQLRRIESAKHEGEGGKEVEWSHRWMVTEHYRNQWYPSTGRHERILITAFVKGPADKPLVIKDRVFVVNR